MEAVATGPVTEKSDDGEALARRREGALRCELETVPVDCLGSVTSASRHFQHLDHFEVRLLPCGRWTVPSIFLESFSVSQTNPFLPMPKPQANINFFTANSSSLRPTFLKISLFCANLSFSVPQASSPLVPCKLT